MSTSSRGRVIVIDDDPALLAVVRRALRSSHDVEAFSSGRAAVERLRSGGPVDVVLCDIVMPELGGDDLYAELERTSPEICERFVFWTGDAFSEKANAFLDRVANRRILKPFDVRELRRLVDEAVAARRA